MVRASRNVSNARRGSAPGPGRLGARAADEFRAWVEYTYPGSSPDEVIANYGRQAATAGQGRPGAALDHFPWARSWGAFLAAVRDEKDPLGARGAITKVRNAMGERVPSAGGFLVPERLRSQVLSYMQTSIVTPRCMYVPMDSLRVPVPVLDNPSQASGAQALGGLTFSFTEEGQPIAASVPQFGRVALEAWPDKALIKDVPNELLEDATPFTESFLPRIIARGLSWHIDDVALYQGTGAGQPEALAAAPGAVRVSRTTSSEVLHADVVAMLKALHPASKCCATWLASEDVFDQLLELYEIVGTAPAGQDIPPPGTLKYNSDSGRWELVGLEIIANDHQPALGTAGDLMLADMSLLLLGDRGEMTAEVSQKGPGFGKGTSYIRIRYRWDARYWLRQSVTLANGKITSPLVILQ